MNRREFVKQGGLTAGLSLSGYAAAEPQGVSIVIEPDDPIASAGPVKWASGELREALTGRRIPVRLHQSVAQAGQGDLCVLAAGSRRPAARELLAAAKLSLPEGPEVMALAAGNAAGKPVLLASGSDVRGLVYALLELADRVRFTARTAAALQPGRPLVEKPANAIRSVTRYFESDVEDKSWYYDKSFWRPYLSMLATQRFNRFSLAFGLGYNRPRDVHDAYFYFSYPFLFSVPGYQVRVPQLPDEERDRNLAMLQWIGEEATAYGLDFQLALWTHAYQWIESPKANYTIDGLTPEKHPAYCRDALHKLLGACPAIKGITLRGHSESGIPEGSYDFWETLFDGFKRAGRKVEIDIHSKGIEHKLLRLALDTGNPIIVSPKYWAEHMGLSYHQASIREEERSPGGDMKRIETQRRFTRYGYGDYLREDRKYGILYRIWPGTQRTLLWGDPATVAGYGRYSQFCGSNGLELSEPLSFKGRMGSGRPEGRNAYADASLEIPGGDWQKHAYTYRLWGRLLYNPEAPPDSWRRYLDAEFGQAAGNCERALARASRILPLVTTAHHPSGSNNGYWPEMYTNMPILAEKEGFNALPSLDPELFSSIEKFVNEVAEGNRSGRYSPLDVARWLESDARAAEDYVAKAKTETDPAKPSFRRWAIDVGAQSGLGHFFAQKLRAGVAYELYRRTEDRPALERAVNHYRLARDAWRRVARITDKVYVDDITYGLTRILRGHWKDRLPAIEKDLAAMEQLLKQAVSAASPGTGDNRRLPAHIDLAALFAASPIQRPRCEHLPSASFHPGKPLAIEMAIESAYQASRVRLHYRHVNQAEAYQVEDMPANGGRYQRTIPAAYTDSPYPLEYFFELSDHQGQAWMYPGFSADRTNQPYFVVRQA